MNIDTAEYETVLATYEELSVVAAFMKIPFFYGVSQKWMNSGYGDLRSKVHRIVKEMENSGRLLIEPGGVLFVQDEMLSLLKLISSSTRIARVAIGTGRKKEVFYFYFQQDSLAFLKADGHGGCAGGVIPSKKCFEVLLSGMSKKEKIKNEWMGLLLMSKDNGIYQTVADITWEENDGEDPMECWKVFCGEIFREV